MHCLKLEMLRYKYASFETMKKRQIYGLHLIENKVTLTSTNIINKKKWGFLEIRSAIIPKQWNDRKLFIKIFELLLALKVNMKHYSTIIDQEIL